MFRTVMLSLLLVPTVLVCAESDPPPSSGSALDRQLHALAESERFSGGVLAAHGERVLFRNAYGNASKEFSVPNSPDTRFVLGSINKMFTATAVLQLVEQGRLDLDATVARHLPGVLAGDVAGRMTLLQLLTHTSGLGDFLFTPELEHRNRADYRTIEDYLPLVADDSPAFEPGTDWQYSNTGYLLLGAILEQETRQDYYGYVREHVLEPAGMQDSGSPALDLVPRGVASTYEPRAGEGRFHSDRYDQVVKGTPAGGGVSTLDDMHRFALALMGGHLLSPEMSRRMLTPKPEAGSERYGFGAQIFPDGWVGHTGGGPGTANYFGFRPATGEVVVVLANQIGDSLEVAALAQQLLQQHAPAEQQAGTTVGTEPR
ncbi:MAG: serine hydrolase domain-containing protein [Pseudomonadota bacterium]